MHIVFVIANESSVPYFNWFAKRALDSPHTFSFVALYKSRPKMLDEMQAIGWRAYWIPFDPVKRKSGMIKCLFQLFRLFKQMTPDVVHTHLFDDSVPGLLAARLAGVKMRVITKQDTAFHWYYAHKWVIFDRFNNWNATHICAISSENHRFIIEKEKAQPQKVHLVRHGCPSETITASRPQVVTSLKNKYELENRIVVGTVARYIHWKGHHLIIEAAKQLIQKYPNLLFIWAGTDAGSGYKHKLQELIDEADLNEHVRMLGWIERKDMPSLYNCMNMYLHPALREPFGFAISEALMNEVPIIATKTGSTDLIEHLKDGYLLDMDNVDSIVSGMEYLLSNDEERKQIGERGKKHAMKNMIFDKMWDGHISMYEQ